MNAFYNGISGVKSQSFGIDTTANNIANINTVGYKYSNAEFKDVFYSTITTQSTNPAQGGCGATSSANKVIFEQGSPVASDGEFDVCLTGKGFFGVLGPDGNVYYTRNGSFSRDANGNLVDIYGNYVLGTMNPAFSQISFSDRVSDMFGNDTNGNPINSGFTVNSDADFPIGNVNSQGIISVPKDMYLPPVITQNVKWSGNLSTDSKIVVEKVALDPTKFNIEQTPDSKIVVSGKVDRADVFSAKPGEKIILTFTDKDGVKKDIEATLDDNLNFTTKELTLDGLDLGSIKISSAFIATEQEKASKDVLEARLYNSDGSINKLRLTLERVLPQIGENMQYKAIAQIYDSDGKPLGDPTEGSVIFDKNGALLSNSIKSIANPDGGTINIDLGEPLDPNKPGSGYSGLHILKDKEKNIVTKEDGSPEGFFNQYKIGSDGSIIAQFSNGKTAVVGKMALYNFINEQGLAPMGENIFAATSNSGDPTFIMKDGKVINTAKFNGGYLEQSNVDLSVQLTELITMQKAFDASSKSITTSDQMIQNAINMKK